MSGDPCCPAPPTVPAGPRTVTRRMAIKGGLALGVIPLLPRLACTDGPGENGDQPQDDPGRPPIEGDFGFDPARPPDEFYDRQIMFPVLDDPEIGSVSWIDSYWAPRGGGTRKHEGQDLMAPKMLKLLACASGTIVELRHRPTGNSLYLKDDDGWYYCYLHINNDTPGTDDGANAREFAFPDGIVEGMRVEQGDHIAYVGDSGNAEYSGSHCHFEIRMPNANMWRAAAVNPLYSLQAAIPAQIRGNPVAPFDSTHDFVVRQANDFLGGVPGGGWLAAAVASIDGGKDADEFIAEQVDHRAVTGVVNPIIRLQLAGFGTTPNRSRVDGLTSLVRGGASLTEAADQTLTQAGLTSSSLTNAEFVIQLHRNMWGRIGSANRSVARRRRLDAGLSRAELLLELVQERDYRIMTAQQVRTSTVWMSMLGTTMPTGRLEAWSALDKVDTTALSTLAGELRSSDHYRQRVT